MKKRALLISVCLTALLAACAPGRAAERTGGLRVTASFYPLYVAALNVVGDAPYVTLSLLAPPDTGCLHDYQLRPEDMIALDEADVLIINGGGLESFLDKALSSRPDIPVVTAVDGLTLLAEEEETPHGEGADGHGPVNPHAWVSITMYMTYVENIRDGLIAADAKNKEIYERNAADYLARLDALRGEMREALDGITCREIVTFHEAFGYFAEEFSLHVAAVIQREPGENPTPAELVETIEAVKASGARALFAEPQYQAEAAETIARETGARVYLLDPAVTGPMEACAYEAAMRENMKVLKEALG